MRIALLTSRFPPEVCGVGDYVFRLAHALAAHGDEPIVFANPASGGQRPEGIRVVDVTLRRRRDIPSLLSAIRSVAPDVVQIEYSPYSWGRYGFAFWVNSLVATLQREQIPVTVAFHELYIDFALFPLQIPIGLVQRLHVGMLVHSSDHTIVNTAQRHETLCRCVPWRCNRIHYRPNGCTISPVEPNVQIFREILERSGTLPGEFIVATFGIFQVLRRYEALIEAVARLRSEFPIKLWLLGHNEAADPRYIAKLKDLISGLGIEDRVYWSWKLSPEEASAHFHAANVLVLPQGDGELTRSSAFMNAAVHGLPVIAVRNPTNAREFSHRTNVYLVKESQPECFVSAIRHLACDPALRTRIAENVHRLYETEFSWDSPRVPLVIRRPDSSSPHQEPAAEPESVRNL